MTQSDSTPDHPLIVPLKWGGLLGVTLCAWTMLLHASGLYTAHIGLGQAADVVALVFPLGAISLAVRERRARAADGRLSLRAAVVTGVGTGMVSAPIAGAFLWVYHRYINPDWLTYVLTWKEAQLAGAGETEAIIAATLARIRAGASDQAQLASTFLGTLVLSLVISIVAGLVLRRCTE